MNIDWQCCVLLSRSHDAALSQLSYFLYQCADKRRKQTRSSCKLAVQRHSDHPTFFFIRKEKNQVSFREYFKKFFSRPVRQVRNNFCTVLFWKIVVFMVNFYVNFLSSRKYDWNVVPRDLEKIRRAHGACVVFFFFLKKESLFTLTTTINKNKQYFFKSFSDFLFLSLTEVKHFLVC